MNWEAGRIGVNVQASIDKGMTNVCSYCGGDVVDADCDKCGPVKKWKCACCLGSYFGNDACRNFTTYCLECFMKN